MEPKKLSSVAMNENHPNYKLAIKRQEDLYSRRNDIRSPFSRDYTRILFSQAYRRLKHKTQVFFAVENDHICTRSEHVNLVESVSYTIAKELGLNTDLTRAIAVGHDLGHAPFGHGGEKILTKIATTHGLDSFWHEKNSLHFVDSIELLEDNEHHYHNLNLTYAIRDGIVSHCGEVNQKHIKPRNEYIDLSDYSFAGQYNPYTYEGCVVKMSDKIAYLARDIEDALRLKILTKKDLESLKEELNQLSSHQFHAINNGSIVNYFIDDVIKHSSIEEGIGLSDEALSIMKTIMKFNYQNIYLINRMQIYNDYVSLMINAIFNTLYEFQNYDSSQLEQLKEDYPKLITSFIGWLEKYAYFGQIRKEEYKNKVVYDLKNDPSSYKKCIIDFIAGMSDQFIIQVFNELISF